MSDTPAFIVTGGSDGLGLATAKKLIAGGANVAICGRDQGRLDRAAETLDATGERVLAVRADVTVVADLDNLISATHTRWSRLDGLMNSAGVHTGKAFADITDEDWQADFELKLMAAVRGARHALPLLKETSGSILNVLSIFAKTPTAGSMPSSVFRAAGMAMTKALSCEAAADGVRVNAILVGFINSNQWMQQAETRGVDLGTFTSSMVDDLNIPLGRQGRSEEFAEVAAFLLSTGASYITGAAIPVDGGLLSAM